MHVLSKKALADFWLIHKDAEKTLKVWHSICSKTQFSNFTELRQTFRTVDKVGKFTVFNIGGNKFRIITVIHYNRKKIYVRRVLTHEQYDLGHWKNE